MGDSLAENFPEFAAELDSERNSGLHPRDVHKGSGKNVFWRCAFGHSFRQRVVDRTGRGYGCPVCSGQDVWPGKTDLATKFPEVARWWDEDLNEARPSEVMPSSHVKFWWKCPEKHSFDLPASKMTSRFSCPVCSGKRIIPGLNDLRTLHPELVAQWSAKNSFGPDEVGEGSSKKVLWVCKEEHEFAQLVHNRTALGQNCPYCAGQKPIVGENDLETLAPELLKEWHHTKNLPHRPVEYMPGSHFKAWWVCRRDHEWKSAIYNRAIGLYGCPYCSGRLVIPGQTDLQSRHPDLVAEWDFERNNKHPSEVSPSGKYKAWWICPLGHSYSAQTYSRISGSGCPTCSNRKVQAGFNDLPTTNPEVLGWWDTKKNKKGPENFTRGSGKKVWWTCPKGHSFESAVSNMSGNPSCPGCAVFGFNPERDGYFYLLRDHRRGYQQIGITNSPESRLYQHRSNGWELVDIRGPLDGYSVRELEASAKKFLSQVAGRFTRSTNDGKFDGFTESWPERNASFNSLDELMKDLRAWEWSQ